MFAARTKHWTRVLIARCMVAGALALLLVVLCGAKATTGTIRATVKSQEPIIRAWVMQTRFTKDGVYHTAMPAVVKEDQLIAANLPLTGRWRLRFQTKSGFIEGWDATVPQSDYVQEQPLNNASKRTIIEKMVKASSRDFYDTSVILDIQGNIQHAAVLVTRLRRRPFVSDGYKPGEWVWRVERWQWDDPLEHTWTPSQDRPFYALVRKRFYEKDYKKLATTYARHLGGIELTSDRPEADLGTIMLPPPKPGVRAMGPDGKTIRPIVIKPWDPSQLDRYNAEDDDKEAAR